MTRVATSKRKQWRHPWKASHRCTTLISHEAILERVKVRNSTTDEWKTINLLRDPLWRPSDFPEQMIAPRLSLEQWWYLYNKIQEFVLRSAEIWCAQSHYNHCNNHTCIHHCCTHELVLCLSSIIYYHYYTNWIFANLYCSAPNNWWAIKVVSLPALVVMCLQVPIKTTLTKRKTQVSILTHNYHFVEN